MRVKLSRALRRTVPLVLVGAAGIVAARRRAEERRRELMPGLPRTPPPPAPAPAPPVEPPAAAPAAGPPPDPPAAEPAPEEKVVEVPFGGRTEAPPAAHAAPGPEDEALTVEAPALGDEDERPDAPAAAPPASVSDIVDDLLSPPADSEIQDATVVDGTAEDAGERPDDGELARRVRERLASQPGLLGGGVAVEVRDGRVELRGEVERPEAISALERQAAEVPGVSGIDSLLHLPGTPPPSAGERR